MTIWGKLTNLIESLFTFYWYMYRTFGAYFQILRQFKMIGFSIFCDEDHRRFLQKIAFWDNIKPQMIVKPFPNLFVYHELHNPT